MHWYNPNVAERHVSGSGVQSGDPMRAAARRLLDSSSALRHGSAAQRRQGRLRQPARPPASQFAPTDFTTWKMVTIRAPKTGEAPTTFYDLPTLRAANELVLAHAARRASSRRPRSSPTGRPTRQQPDARHDEPDADRRHRRGHRRHRHDDDAGRRRRASTRRTRRRARACFGCHQLLDPTRSIFSAPTRGTTTRRTTRRRCAQNGHVRVPGRGRAGGDASTTSRRRWRRTRWSPPAWAQKLCYYVNSAPCATDDPEFQRVVGVFQQVELLVERAGAASCVIVAAHDQRRETATRRRQRRGHRGDAARSPVRGARQPARPGRRVRARRRHQAASRRTWRRSSAGCRPTATGAARRFRCCPTSRRCSTARAWRTSASRSRRWSSTPRRRRSSRTPSSGRASQPDAAIADFVATVMALTASDPRSAPATQLLKSHFTQAEAQGAIGVGRAQVDVRGGVPGAVGNRDRAVRRMAMQFTRRQTLMSALFGAGYVGLRALATGLPASFLLNPRRALAAAPACTAANGKAQFIIFSTSGNGDPINANVPGHLRGPEDRRTASIRSWRQTPLTIGGQPYTAAAPWATLPQSVLDRTCFWHLMTNTPVHPKEPDVLKLMGATYAGGDAAVAAGQAAGALSRHGAGAADQRSARPRRPRGCSYEGAGAADHPAARAQGDADQPGGPARPTCRRCATQTLQQLYDLYKNGASQSQRAYLDRWSRRSSRCATSTRTCSTRWRRSRTTRVDSQITGGADADPDEGDAGGRDPHSVRRRQPPRRGAGDRDGADGVGRGGDRLA